MTTRPAGPSGAPPPPAIRVEGLTKSFGTFTALRGIDFIAARGEVLGLLGPNGAGKTTTVHVLSTLLRPDAGTVEVAGHDVAVDPGAVRRSIMLTGQFAALDDMLTAREILVLFGRLMGLRRRAARTRAAELLDQFGLSPHAARRVGTFSGGMRRRLDIACGLVVRPEVVFLDEPTTGLDPRSRQAVWELVTGFREQGITTLLTTQYLEEADALCDRIVVIDRGTVVADAPPAELKSQVGASYCEIVPRDAGQLPRIAALLGAPTPRSEGADRICVPAPRGAASLVEVAGTLAATGIDVTGVSLRRPSLDEVFFALTEGESPGAGLRDHEAVCA